jgi:phenylacetate-CoA ligase
MTNLFKELIFLKSPWFIQNHLVSMYGKGLYKKRYLGIYQDLLKEIEQVDSKLQSEIEELQVVRLKKMLLHAQSYVPYYKKLFNEIGFDANTISSLADIELIPPLDKDIFRSAPASFRSTRKIDRSFIRQKTSGSSGKPIELEVDEKTYKRAMALLVHHEQIHGVKFGAPRATFAGRMIQPIDKMTPPFSRYNRAENQRLFSSYHLNEKTISFYARELDEFQPEELVGYPSAIYSLAFLLEKMSLSLKFKPKLIITNSETLLDWQREKIEKVLGAPVLDYYGTAEYVVFANQCSQGNYHINPFLGYLEVVDSESNPVFEEEGEVLCTTLSNFVMPLIRYRVGDRAVKNSASCACNIGTETLSEVIGRVDDYLLTIDDRKIGRLDHIYKGLEGIREGQLIQNSRSNCVVKIVPTVFGSEIDEYALTDNFRQRVGDGINLKIEYVSSIPKNKNGKFKAVVNLISD